MPKQKDGLEGPSVGRTKPSLSQNSKLLREKGDGFWKSDHDGRKPVGGEAEETTQRWASRLCRGEAETQAEVGSAGPRRVAGQHEEAAGRTCMESARSTPVVLRTPGEQSTGERIANFTFTKPTAPPASPGMDQSPSAIAT